MGLVYAAIELINGEDIVWARRGIIEADEIKQMYIQCTCNPFYKQEQHL